MMQAAGKRLRPLHHSFMQHCRCALKGTAPCESSSQCSLCARSGGPLHAVLQLTSSAKTALAEHGIGPSDVLSVCVSGKESAAGC